MYVVGISGSPRKEGNTAILVKETLKAMKGKKKFIALADLNINPCKSCDRCWKEKIECVTEDDIKWILRELNQCDAMIVGSPCYFKSVSAQLKMLMDRSVSLYSPGSLRNKLGAVIVTHDVHGWGGALVVQAIRDFFDAHKIIFAGSVIGEGGEKAGHVKKDKRAMKRAKDLAHRVMELAKLTKRRT